MLALGGLLGVAAAQDSLIIYYGVGTYRAVSTFVKLLCAVLGITDAGVIGAEIHRFNVIKKEEAAKIAAREEKLIEADRAKRDEESVLSVKKRLSEQTIRKELTDGMSEWEAYKDGIRMLIDQSARMDDQQSKLSDLLRKNGADKLDDAEDILDRVEQGLLKNIRKVLNYMEVGSPDRSADCEKVKGSIEECIKENDKLLENTSGFLISLTDYLNTQGENDRDEMATLLSFKDILIQSTKVK